MATRQGGLPHPHGPHPIPYLGWKKPVQDEREGKFVLSVVQKEDKRLRD